MGDDMSSPNVRQGLVGRVSAGNEDVVRQHGSRSLLLVYPNPGPMARRCLDNYTGDTLVYVGEGRGGVNADDAFFDALAQGWRLLSSHAVDALPDCHECVYILRRHATCVVE